MTRNNRQTIHKASITKWTRAATKLYLIKKHHNNGPKSCAVVYTSRICTSEAYRRYRSSCFEDTHTSTQSESVEFVPSYQRSIHKPEPNASEMGCIASRPVRTITSLRSRTLRMILWLGVRLTEIFSWLKDSIPSRRVKTYPTLSEPGPHVPEIPPSPAKDLYGDHIDRYDWAYAEMSLPKSERMRRQSAPEPPRLSRTNSNTPGVDVGNGERLDLTGDPFLFL